MKHKKAEICRFCTKSIIKGDFFHMSGLRGLDLYGLRQGMAVEFDVEKSPRLGLLMREILNDG